MGGMGVKSWCCIFSHYTRMLHKNRLVLVSAGTNATHEGSGEILLCSHKVEKLYACTDHLENGATLLWIRTDISEGLHTSVPPKNRVILLTICESYKKKKNPLPDAEHLAACEGKLTTVVKFIISLA